MIETKSTEETLALYREAAIRTATTSTSDPKESNKWAEIGVACYRKLSTTQAGKTGIVTMMSDDNGYVRGLAAAHSLQWVPSQAIAVLEELRDADGPGAFEAKWTLIEYGNGTLSFD